MVRSRLCRRARALNGCASAWPNCRLSQVVFATDYPQAVRDDDEIVAYVKAVGGLGSEARKILDGANAEKLIPNLKERLKRTSSDRLRRSMSR